MLIAAVCTVWIGAGIADAQSVASAEPRFTLSGVVVLEGGAGRAWLQEPKLTQNQVVSIRAGESIGAYRLTRVLEDRVELEGPAGKLVVPLAGASGPAVATNPAPAAPAPPAPAAATEEVQRPAGVPMISRDDRPRGFGSFFKSMQYPAGRK
jgi:hypothetical protein